VSTRTYLSIGDVLSLLRQEFPDITISKIRFLESQGLVDPERSPSGYRKFYEPDVERLRWVLRQQREHFLPLKVIRDRLARSGDITTDMEDFDPEAASAEIDDLDETADFGTEETDEEEFDEADEPVPVVASAANGSYQAEEDEEPAWVDAPSESRAGAFAVTSSPLAPRSSSVKTAQVSRREPAVKARDEQPGSGSTNPEAPEIAVAPSPAPPEPAPRPSRPSRETATAVDQGHAAHITGASLTLDELCSASGLGATEVASLEGFGLIEPMVVGGALYYDEDGLTVAKLVADFARYGIEPRHLRLFRNAVDRELGLIEQVVTPLLRQRNPEARQRAVDAAAELSRLGQALRGAILRRALRHHLGG